MNPSNYLHGSFNHTIKPTLTGNEEGLELNVLKDKTLNVAVQIIKKESGFFGWIKGIIRSFSYKPLTVINETTGRQTRVLLNVADAVKKFSKLGFEPGRVKQAIANDSLFNLIKEQKVDDIFTFFYGTISKKDLNEAVDWINEHPRQDPSTFNPQNPIRILLKDGLFYLSIHGYELALDDTLAKVNHTVYEAPGFNKGFISGISHLFQSKVGQIQEYSAKIKTPEIFNGLQKEVTILSSNKAMLHTGKSLGEGSYKKVALAVEAFSNKHFATYDVEFEDDLSMQEVRDLKSFKGIKGIVQIHDSATFEDQGFLKVRVFTKFYDKGSLLDVLEKKQLSKDQKLKVAKQLLKGLQNLHHVGLIHRDLKPGNILVKTSKKQGIKAVISDLGALTKMQDQEKRKEHLTTSWYTSPEYAQAQIDQNEGAKILANTSSLDVWSMGVILYELFHGERPIWLQNLTGDERAVFRKIAAISFPVNFPNPLPINRLLSQMLCPNATRINIDEAIRILETLT